MNSARTKWDKILASWNDLIKHVQELPPHVDLLIKKSQVKEPWLYGFRKSSIGWRKGAMRTWRLALTNGKGIHIREYSDHFKIHWDIADPRKNPLKHFVYDTRRLYNAIRILLIFIVSATFAYHPEILQALINVVERGAIIP
ncbi:MAG: hypothetical protein QW514_04500 [Thermoprotei archaeon]